MGLDGVELIIAIEEEFGIDIADSEAEKLFTAGDIFELLKTKVARSDPGVCLTQQTFYKLRRALIENYGLKRHEIKLDTKMCDLLSDEEIKDGWPFLETFIELKTPPYEIACQLLGFKLTNKQLTMRELVQSLIVINKDSLVPKRDSDEEIWFRLVTLMVRQLNLRPDEIKPEASLAKDLGID